MDDERRRKAGRLFTDARIKAGLTQEDVAEAADYSVDSIRRFENGQTVPHHRNLHEIVNAVAVPAQLDPDKLREDIRRALAPPTSSSLSHAAMDEQEAFQRAPALMEAKGQFAHATLLRHATPFQAPPLPPHFIERPRELEQLSALLLTPPSHTLPITAIHGLPAAGKSTLARALAHAPDVRARFPEGVLWATLGTAPNLLSFLTGWAADLAPPTASLVTYTTFHALCGHLRSLLHERAVLLVIDDAWEIDHVRPFLVGGPRCHVLLTTRRAYIAHELGVHHPVELEGMTPEQSLALLSKHLKHPLDDLDRDIALRLANALGYLPLALELAAGRLNHDVSWADLLAAVQHEVAALEQLEDPRRRRLQGELQLEAAFNWSLAALDADAAVQRHFMWLGVLPEDATFAAPMAQTLWNVSQAEATDVLELLWDDALLIRGAPIIAQGRSWEAYQLHDLLHDYARRGLTTRTTRYGLGLTLPAAHAALLDAYARRHMQRWHTLPDDGYIHDHLTWHMEKAERVNALHALLREETDTGTNGWYYCRDSLGQLAGYVADIARAWRLAEVVDLTAHNIDERDNAIAVQCRYALIEASIGNLATNIAPVLLVALVEHKVRTPAYGLAYARRILNERQHARALVGLAPYLSPELMQDALADARTIANTDENAYAEALAGLVRRLAELGREREALTSVQGVTDEYWRAQVLVQLPAHLSTLGLLEAVTVAQDMVSPTQRVRVLAAMARYLPKPLLQETLMTVQAAVDSYGGAEALVEVAHYLPEGERVGVFAEAVASARATANEYERDHTLQRVATRLAALGHDEEALDTVSWISTPSRQEEARAQVVPYIAALGHERKALTIAVKLAPPALRADALMGVAAQLPKGERRAALDAARAAADNIQSPYQRASFLVPLLGQLAEAGDGPGALATASQIRNPMLRSQALTEVAPWLSDGERQAALNAARAAADEVIPSAERARQLARVATRLPEGERQEALDAARAATDEIADLAERVPQMVKVAAELSAADRAASLAAALMVAQSIEIGDRDAREQVLEDAAVELAVLGDSAGALIVAARIERGVRWSRVMVRVAPYLSLVQLHETVTEVLSTSNEQPGSQVRERAMVDLAPLLAARLIPWLAARGDWKQAIEAAQAITDETTKLSALRQLAPVLAALGRGSDALAATREIKDVVNRSWVLRGLVPRLMMFDDGKQVLASIQNIEDEFWQSQVAAELVPHMAALGLTAEALAAAKTIKDAQTRAKTLWALVPCLTTLSDEERRGEAMDAAVAAEEQAQEERQRLQGPTSDTMQERQPLQESMRTFARDYGRDGRDDEEAQTAERKRSAKLRELLAAVRMIPNVLVLNERLASLVPFLTDKEKVDVLPIVLDTVRTFPSEVEEARRSRISLLVGLIPHLAEEQRVAVLTTAYNTAREFRNPAKRVEILAWLLPYLSQEKQAAVVKDAWNAAQTIDDSVEREVALVWLVPSLVAVGDEGEGTDTAVHPNQKYWQTMQTVLLDNGQKDQPSEQLYASWRDDLHDLAARPRQELLAAIRVRITTVIRLGGMAGLRETARAVADVGHWFP